LDLAELMMAIERLAHQENIGGLAISGLNKRMNRLVIFGLKNHHRPPLTFKSTSVCCVTFICKLPGPDYEKPN
jgi:hypothetical protein